MKRAIIAALGAALLAGCSATAAPVAPSITSPAHVAQSASTAPVTATTATPTTSPTQSPTPAATGLKMGSTAKGEVASWTVYEAKRLPKRTGGETGWGALIKTCITSDAGGPYTITSRVWSLVGPDSETYEPTSIGYQQDITPQLNDDESKAFKAGQCSKGWVIFDVPATENVSVVRYQNSVGETHDWRVSK